MNPNTDPFEISNAFYEVNAAWLKHRSQLSSKVMELNRSLQETNIEALKRFFSDKDILQKAVNGDKAAFMGMVKKYSLSSRKFHTVWSQWLRSMVENAPEIKEDSRQRSIFWTDQMLNSLVPSNFFFTNPGALQRFIRTNGESLQKGFQNWLTDFKRGDNMITLADETAFKAGENIAVTPGSVVFRNELMELIQYSPATDATYKMPIVLIQPWINKFYIFDLSPSNSFVKYLIEQGYTVFITSWKNPSSDMRHITFDDYMFKGTLQAVNAAREICAVNQVHAAGYCIGGTVLAALMAWLNQVHDKDEGVPIADGTMFSTLTDFSDPGSLSVFMGEPAIEAVEKLMEKEGFLDSKYIGLSFRLLNPESLIWRYAVNNYLFGEMPPRSDMLYWNSDGTRLPQAMCSFYLREFYLKNNLIRKNRMVLGGRPINLKAIRQSLYIVGARQDHISPWKGTFRSFNFIGCPVRYVLASEGHITGIVNPPSARSKKRYQAANANPKSDPDEWVSSQEEQKGTWWPDWIKWLSERDDSKVPPPSSGSEAFPVLGPAPGVYITE